MKTNNNSSLCVEMYVGIRVLGHLLFFMLGLMMDWCLFGRVSLLTFSHTLCFNFSFFRFRWSDLTFSDFLSPPLSIIIFFSFCPAVEVFSCLLTFFSKALHHFLLSSLSLSFSVSLSSPLSLSIFTQANWSPWES